MFDTVDGALQSCDGRPVETVLEELGVHALLSEGGNLFDAALVELSDALPARVYSQDGTAQ